MIIVLTIVVMFGFNGNNKPQEDYITKAELLQVLAKEHESIAKVITTPISTSIPTIPPYKVMYSDHETTIERFYDPDTNSVCYTYYLHKVWWKAEEGRKFGDSKQHQVMDNQVQPMGCTTYNTTQLNESSIIENVSLMRRT